MAAASEEQIYNQILTKLRTGFLNQAVIDVVHNLTGETISEVKVPGKENEMLCLSYITSFLFMAGPVNMLLIIGMPKQDASEIVSRLTAMAVELLTEENFFDLVNEISNMVSGRCKALLNQMGLSVANAHSFTVSGEDFSVFHRSKIKSISKRYRAAALEVNVRILFL